MPLFLLTLDAIEYGRPDEEVGDGRHYQGEGSHILLLHPLLLPSPTPSLLTSPHPHLQFYPLLLSLTSPVFHFSFSSSSPLTTPTPISMFLKAALMSAFQVTFQQTFFCCLKSMNIISLIKSKVAISSLCQSWYKGAVVAKGPPAPPLASERPLLGRKGKTAQITVSQSFATGLKELVLQRFEYKYKYL